MPIKLQNITTRARCFRQDIMQRINKKDGPFVIFIMSALYDELWIRIRIHTTENFSKYYFDQKLQFTYVRGLSKLKEKPSALKREHPALQMTFIDFFLCLWDPSRIRIRIANPDQDTDKEPH